MSTGVRRLGWGLLSGVVKGPDGVARCPWGLSPPEYQAYHDSEWGRPVGDDRRVFEKLCLEGFQAGLSWLTILRKRDAFRAAFAGFDPAVVAGYDDADVERLLANADIVRHQGKIRAVIANAQAAERLAADGLSLAGLLWSYEPSPASRLALTDLPATTPESAALSKDLRRRGFRFVGPTTVYATMQALGVVNDHLDGCAFRAVADAERAHFVRPATRAH